MHIGYKYKCTVWNYCTFHIILLMKHSTLPVCKLLDVLFLQSYILYTATFTVGISFFYSTIDFRSVVHIIYKFYMQELHTTSIISEDHYKLHMYPALAQSPDSLTVATQHMNITTVLIQILESLVTQVYNNMNSMS